MEHEHASPNPEPRFYPTFAMKIDIESWRQLPQGERVTRGFTFDGQIKRLLRARVEELHPDWSRDQHDMMFFRLLYAGEHFEQFAREKETRGHWKPEEIEVVRATPIPLSREDSEPYAAISHPDLDEDLKLWPNSAERGSNF